ncbi:hypothetical protein ACO0LC_20890 [Undibacterium sp. JH2W]|uniref:hypothetical protein n=1 Tax=Undibacterium sp. JH2W TaxID=3413037 RepID=UPI003BF2B694
MKPGRIDVAFEFGAGFDVVFDFLQFPCVDAVCAVQKIDLEGPLFEVQQGFRAALLRACVTAGACS